MTHSLYATAGIVLAAILLYRFHQPILAALARFDARNMARKFAEARDRRDRLAHYRHTVRLAEEQVDEITEIAGSDQRTAAPVIHFVFAGETFATREDAEAAITRSWQRHAISTPNSPPLFRAAATPACAGNSSAIHAASPRRSRGRLPTSPPA
jgi:hypothetical protein